MQKTIVFIVLFIVGVLSLPSHSAAQRITAVWQGQELGTALERLADTKQSPLWLDRRVDPQQTVDIRFTDVSFSQALAELTEQRDLGFSRLDEVIYVGPSKTARGLASLASQARASLALMPEATQQLWLRAEASSWPRLTQPRELLTSLLGEVGAELVNSEVVPHDLWPARELPPLALVDRVVLVLAGFDLTCDLSPNGRSCRVVPIKYPLPVVEGPLHAEARAPVPSATTGTRRMFSLQLENQPVGRVIEQLAEQLDLQVAWNDDSLQANKRSHETLVSCQVTDVDLEALLKSILAPAGLGFTKAGQRVEIYALP